MNDCERYEVMVSTQLDGELDRGEQTEMLDHLVRCSACRDFYVGARHLAGLVAAVGTTVAEQPSPEVWKRIERSALRPQTSFLRRLPRRTWAPAAAAAAVLLVIVGSLLARPGVSTGAPASVAEVRLGGNPAGMSDARFVELTREVLGADRKYRAAFYEVMKQVAHDTRGNESSDDVLAPRSESGEKVAPPETTRVPS